MSAIQSLLQSVLAVFTIALLVRLAIRNRERVAYASVLVLVGLAVAALGISLDVTLTGDLILDVLLPTIIFQGTTTIDVQVLWERAPLVVVLTLVGLPAAVALLGVIGTVAFGFPPLVTATSLVLDESVPRYCQHVMVWGGLHTVVPVALALSLPGGLAYRREIQTMVFGVAVISIVIQGLLMPVVLRVTGNVDAEQW
jgi:CPA1 family monovalent cation:H+ antiporter